MTRCNGCIITGSLQQRVTFPRKVQDNSQKPIQPDVMVATKLAAYRKE